MPYYRVHEEKLQIEPRTPSAGKTFVRAAEELLPPQISTLHQEFQAWGQQGLSPGPVLAHRIWIGPNDTLYFQFPVEEKPQPLGAQGLAPDLAAWLVLLDKWMETFVVIARARTVWSPLELAGALRFTSPPYLPGPLTAEAPDNWARVAHALAVAVADGPLAGEPENRHWQER